ncbi:hypothetical protein NAT51_04430 [Flavobacterium amniphilum]|uniref:hypothetical protein n=1 Tax=Flavobacterium amniphilum TaxID=1834035 RepID=UPI00202A1B6D|nr:hypothetical protein [Flavobacterium amniphilum]MCL9804755.1 hypothetical protein [Flavobacterium amniphilum]
MGQNNYVIVVLLLLFQNVFAQSVLKGRVISEVNPDGIMVANFTTKTSTITADGGYFAIEANPGDILVVTAKYIEGVQLRLTIHSFDKGILNIAVKTKAGELAEIKVNAITAKSQGIVSKNVKEYTPAERKLKTAGKLKWYSPLLIPLGGMSVDGLINQLSGRTSMLKKELSVEKKEILLAALEEMFLNEYYVETLQIPEEYISGFQIYALDNVQFAEAVKNKNRTLVAFLIGDIAGQYKTLILEDVKK